MFRCPSVAKESSPKRAALNCTRRVQQSQPVFGGKAISCDLDYRLTQGAPVCTISKWLQGIIPVSIRAIVHITAKETAMSYNNQSNNSNTGNQEETTWDIEESERGELSDHRRGRCDPDGWCPWCKKEAEAHSPSYLRGMKKRARRDRAAYERQFHHAVQVGNTPAAAEALYWAEWWAKEEEKWWAILVLFHKTSPYN